MMMRAKWFLVVVLWGMGVLPWMDASAAELNEGSFGELIYVPIYSSIFYHDSKKTVELAATLSIHNVDPENTLTVQKADYYNTSGKLIRRYLEAPMMLQPLETKNFVVDKTDTSGGTGANFLIEWRSAKAISSPLAEALMISLSSGQSISFTSNGRVVRRLSPAN